MPARHLLVPRVTGFPGSRCCRRGFPLLSQEPVRVILREMCWRANSPPGQEGWLRHKEKGRLPCWRRRGGRSSTEAIRSATRALTYLPPRRSRSKTIARVCPSCPGGEFAHRYTFLAITQTGSWNRSGVVLKKASVASLHVFPIPGVSLSEATTPVLHRFSP